MADLRKVFAENLKQMMDERGITPSAFAAAIGKQTSYVSQLRSGKIGFSADSLDAYAAILRCPPWELIVEPRFIKDATYLGNKATQYGEQLRLQKTMIEGLNAQIELIKNEKDRIEKELKELKSKNLEVVAESAKLRRFELIEVIDALIAKEITPIDMAFIRETLRLPPKIKVKTKPKAE